MMLQMLEDIRDGPANMAGGARGSFLKMEGGKVSSVFHIAEEECKSFLTALCTRMTCTNHDAKCNKFHPLTWKIHVRILRPTVVREKHAPAHMVAEPNRGFLPVGF